MKTHGMPIHILDYVEQAKTIQMTRFLGDEMTLKITLLLWEPMVTYNGLVSWVIVPNQTLQPSMTSTCIGVFFSIIANLYCRTNSLSIKHVDALESINV
jgi:hypothetical protein